MLPSKISKGKEKGGFGLVSGLPIEEYFYTNKHVSSSLSDKGFKREVLENTSSNWRLWGRSDMTIDILQSRYRIIEVPVNMKHAEQDGT